MLNNTNLYGFFITFTISNSFLHSILILAEYFIFIFPYVLYSGNKIRYYNKKYDFSKFEKAFILLRNLKQKVIPEGKEINDCFIPYYISILSITIFALIVYYLLVLLYNNQTWFKSLLKVLVNFYNIFFFRYFAFFVIDTLTFCFLSFIVEQDSFTKSILTYCLLIIQILYYLALFYFVSNYSVYIKIANRDIIKSQMDYPYDSFSSFYESIMLVFKILISFEANYSVLKDDHITHIGFFLDLLIIIFSIVMLGSVIYKNLFLNINLVVIYTNLYLNMIRKFIIAFNFCVAVLSILLSGRRSLTSQFCILIISIILGIAIVFAIWELTEVPKIYSFSDEVSEEVVVFLMSVSFTLGTKAIKNGNLSFYETIMSIMQTNHLLYCKNPKECVICSKIKSLDISVYEKLYYLYKLNVKNQNDNRITTYHHYLIKLFYSKIKNQTYKFFKYYYLLINNKKIDVPVSIQNTLSYLVNDTMETENQTGNIYLKVLIQLADYNNQMKELLKNMQLFFEQDISLKTADQILELSKDLNDKYKFLYDMLIKLDVDSQNAKITTINAISTTEKNSKDLLNKKNLEGACKYNITLSRYIIETLLNTKFKKIAPLNIDILEDFLGYHFEHDKMLIISSYIEKKESKSNFEIVKATGVLGGVPIKAFDAFFPKKFMQTGNEKMFKAVSSNISGVNGSFEYVISLKGDIEHFKYNFEIAKTIIDEKVMIYGDYSSSYKNIILIEVNTNQSSFGIEPGDIKVTGFSKNASKLLMIKSYHISLLNQMRNVNLNMSNIFKNIKIVKNDQDNFLQEMHCIIGYDHLYKIFDSLKEYFQKNCDKKSKEYSVLENEVKKIEKRFMTKKSTHIRVTLKKIFTLTKTCFVYNMIQSVSKKGLKRDKGKKTDSRNINSSLNISDDDKMNSSNEDQNKEYNVNENSSQIIQSSTEGSSITGSSFRTDSSVFKEEAKANILIKKETRDLKIISLSIYGLNLFLILLCIIFLIIQISQTNELKSVNTIYFEFKQLRIYFNNIFFSITSTICVCENAQTDECTNIFLNYMDDVEGIINYDNSLYTIREYIQFEVQNKIDHFKDFYSDFKNHIQNDKYSNFLALLDKEIIYISLQQLGTSLTPYSTKVTFQQEIEMFVNCLYVLVDEENEESSNYMSSPFYIFTFENKEDGSTFYDFSNYMNKKLSNVQHSLFKILINFANYAASFDKGEEDIKQKLNSLRSINLVFSIVFMILLAVFNTFILIINSKNLNIASFLFKKLICRLLFRLENLELKQYILNKVENLTLLSDMYSKYPSGIVEKIKVEQKKFNKNNIIKENSKKEGEKEENEEEINFLNSVSNNSFHLIHFRNSIIIPLYLRNFLFFAFYYAIAITLDVVLIIIINSVFEYQDYVTYNYDFQTNLYLTISIVHLFRLINTTEDSYAIAVGKDGGTDGIINGYLRDSLDNYWKFYQYQVTKGYVKLIDNYENDCDTLYSTIKDSYFEKFYDELKIHNSNDRYNLQRLICKHYQFDKFSNLYFILEDFMTILQYLHNRYTDRSYVGLYSFSKDSNLARSYLYLYFFIRPVKQNFDVNILTPEILSKFTFYVTFVWIFLGLNMIMELILFIFNKVFIVNNIESIQDSFFLFLHTTE